MALLKVHPRGRQLVQRQIFYRIIRDTQNKIYTYIYIYIYIINVKTQPPYIWRTAEPGE